MKFENHAVLSSALFVVVLIGLIQFKIVLSVEEIVIGYVYYIVSALAPDLDSSTSFPLKVVNRLGYLSIAILIIIEQTGFALAAAIILFFVHTLKHRGVLHNYLVVPLVFLSVLFFSDEKLNASFAAAGYLSHLVIDSISNRSMPHKIY